MDARYTCSVFIVPGPRRRPAVRVASDLIERAGFDVIDTFEVPEATVKEVTGALWTIGPGRLRGDVFTAFVTVDVCPWPPEDRPRPVDNGRLLRVGVINEKLEDGAVGAASSVDEPNVPPSVWVTPTKKQAEQVICAWRSSERTAYREECEHRRAAIEPPFDVVASFDGFRNNARVDLVRSGGHVVVCKTFRQGRERYMENELEGLRLSTLIPSVPRMIGQGENWVLMPYYEDYLPLSRYVSRQWLRTLLPLSIARKAFRIARAIHEAGYAHLDFHPEHVLINKDRDLKIFDFDRLHRFDQVPPFEESPMITGAESFLEFDGPNGRIPSYRSHWRYLIGTDLRTFLEGSFVERHSQRMAEEARRVPSRVRQLVGNGAVS